MLDKDLKIFNSSFNLYENENSCELDNSFNYNLFLFNNNSLLNKRTDEDDSQGFMNERNWDVPNKDIK